MRRAVLRVAACLAASLMTAGAQGLRLDLAGAVFPEGRVISVALVPHPDGPGGRGAAKVQYRQGEAAIHLAYDSMKPALIYGGDVTCFVLWAVGPDGSAENLGELPVGAPKGTAGFVTIKDRFALMVTAETFSRVRRPSPLVALVSGEPRGKGAEGVAIRFSGFGPAPTYDAAAAVKPWAPSVAPELLQARRTHELAAREGAPAHAPDLHRRAGELLASAERLAVRSPRGKKVVESARRGVDLDSEAIEQSQRRREALDLERRIEVGRAEMERLSAQAQEALDRAAEARRQVEALRADALALTQEKAGLESDMAAMRSELFSMEETLQGLQTEKRELSSRLGQALSHVAETRNSARGFVVNLPDILFDVDQATLRPEAQVILAKLTGILLVIPDLQVVIEGHTDAVGSPEYNQRLSRRRAEGVKQFMIDQGISEERLGAIGFGLAHPVADNTTAEGRRQNRRVEILILDEEAD